MSNLVVSYDLHQPMKNYNQVTQAIKKLFPVSIKVHLSVWHVKTSLSAEQVRNLLRPHIDNDDSLWVVDASKDACAWYNLKLEVEQFIKSKWPEADINRHSGALGGLYR